MVLAKDVIMLVTRDDETARTVSAALGDGVPATLGTCASLEALVSGADRAPVRVAVIDIDPAPELMLAELATVTGRLARTTFILVATEVRSEWLLEAMQAGARHFVRKDEIHKNLAGAITRLSPRSPLAGEPSGSAVTVLSAGGGCGATTVAVNLAHELGLAASEPTLLIDLDCAYGGVAGYLGATATYGVADVLGSGERLDAQLIRSSAIEHDKHLHLLASPATVDMQPVALSFDTLPTVLRESRAAFEQVVVDAPRVPLDAAEVLARASMQTLVVFEMNVQDIRVARDLLAGLKGRGIAHDRLLPVANRYRGRKDSISLDEVRAAIGESHVFCVGNDFRTVIKSINFGKTLAETAPRAEVRREIQRLAKALRERAAAAPAS